MLKRNKMLTFVGIPGLALGLTVVLLIVSYLKSELSYDNHFTTKNRVVRLLNTAIEGQTGTYPICLRSSYVEIPSKIAEVEAATQLYRGWDVLISKDEKDDKYRADLLFADPDFFKVFDQKLLVGNQNTALKGKNKVVLTEKLANKIFGSTNCVGKSINFEFYGGTSYTVSGIVENLPENTHFKYQLLASMETLPVEKWKGLEFFTYFLIKENTDIETASAKIVKANQELMKPWEKNTGIKVVSETELLKNIKYSKAMFDISHQHNILILWIVSAVALFVLIIALVNFINLYTLHSNTRIGEISMRKSLGATRKNLAHLFFSDTTIMAVIALILAVGFASFIAPYFSDVLYTTFTLSELLNPLGVVIILFLLLLIVVSASSNSLYSLSRHNLALGVKGKTEKVDSKNYVTKIALLVQFSITAFLIAGVLIFYAQIRYIKNTPLGFDLQNVNAISGLSKVIAEKTPSIKEELEKLSFVKDLTSSAHYMGGGTSGQAIKKYGSTDKPIPINEYRVHSNFCNTMKIQFLEGNGFTNDNMQGKDVILNETAVKQLELKNPIGKQVVLFKDPMNVIGVVKDFYYESNAGQRIQPLVLTNYNPRSNVIYIRTDKKLQSEQKQQIESIFKQFDDTYKLNTYPLERVYNNMFTIENSAMSIIGGGALLTILLSISGLVAMSLISINRRTKEIGVRKVMGSSESQILYLLLKQTFTWVAIASVIGFIVNYIVMQEIMQQFANRINISFVYFLLSGIIVVLISILAVGWQTWRAASRNPVKALRYE